MAKYLEEGNGRHRHKIDGDLEPVELVVGDLDRVDLSDEHGQAIPEPSSIDSP